MVNYDISEDYRVFSKSDSKGTQVKYYVVHNEHGFRAAPIFDNGQGLLQNCNISPISLPIEERYLRLCGATISANFELQWIAAGKHFKLDYSRLSEKLKVYISCDAIEFLLMQLKKYEQEISDI